jgi:hypothetical protein
MSKEPRPSQPTHISYHPNDSLAMAIVRAWSDPEYKRRLLTFPEKDEADWSKIKDPARREMIRKSSKALAEVDVFLEMPVVLTSEQYDDYKPKAKKEVVFVLPDPIGGNSLETARIAMAVQVRGM